MRATKEFYDTLREEVNKSEDRHSLFLFPSPFKKKEEDKPINSEENNKIIVQLQEKIKGLQSQVDLLEKRNEELIEENNNLQASQSPVKLLDIRDFDDEEKEFLWGFTKDQYEQFKIHFTKGYIPIENVIDWAYNACGDDSFISLIRNMFQDLEWKKIVKQEDYCGIIQKHEKERLARRNQPAIGEVVLEKNIKYQVNGVASGATGVSVNESKE